VIGKTRSVDALVGRYKCPSVRCSGSQSNCSHQSPALCLQLCELLCARAPVHVTKPTLTTKAECRLRRFLSRRSRGSYWDFETPWHASGLPCQVPRPTRSINRVRTFANWMEHEHRVNRGSNPCRGATFSTCLRSRFQSRLLGTLRQRPVRATEQA
jgi:hypothetical protein